MWSFRNLFAVGLFLFGTTYLWMTASFAGKASPPTGRVWTLENILAIGALAGFTIAAWGAFKHQSYWETVAMVSAVIGLVAVVPFVIGLRQAGLPFADLGVQINLWMHLLGSAAIIAIARVPVLHDFVAHRL